MRRALVVNRADELAEMYGCLLEARGYMVRKSDGRGLAATIEELLASAKGPLVVLADCARPYIEQRCVYEALRVSDFSRLRVLITADHLECPFAPKNGIRHYATSDISAIADWIAQTSADDGADRQARPLI